MSQRGGISESVRTGFWAVPAACVALAVLLGVGLVELDRRLSADVRLAFGAGPDGAREVLSAISTSMITFTGLVFSITILVLQLTSSQFSPRVLRTFLRDRQTQLSLGAFVATFVYAVTVLRTVSGVEDQTFVPAVATTVGVLLLLVSVGVFVGYIHHIATSIQISSILGAIGAETRRTIDRRHPAEGSGDGPPLVRPAGPGDLDVPAPGSGVLTRVREQRLVELARAADVVLSTGRRPGEFVPEGAPLLAVHGDPAGLDVEAARGCFTLARERSMDQDVAFGLRQLVDIAEKALSPGINDPTTAVQALDQLHDLLRRLATRSLRDGLHADRDGRLRLAVPAETFADHLALALDEIDQYGSDTIQVQQRLAVLLADLRSVARPEHQAALAARRPR